MPTSNTDKRLLKGEETYQKILLSAIEIIAKNGVGGITASKLSAISQISKSTIFHHFRSTNEIPEAVLDVIFQELMIPGDQMVDKDIREYLKQLGNCVVCISEAYEKIYKSFLSFYHESMFNEMIQQKIRHFLATSKEQLGQQLKKYAPKTLSDQQAETYAMLILATLDGIGLHILIKGDHKEYLRAWELQIDIICRSLLSTV